MRVILRLFAIAMALQLVLAVTPGRCLATTELISNGSFSSGLANWQVNPILGNWNPLRNVDGKDCITVGTDSWTHSGSVIYQPLNVTDIGGKTVTVSVSVKNEWWYMQGRAVGVYLHYLDTSGQVHHARILNPENAEEWYTDSDTYTLPANAHKLVRLTISREENDSVLVSDISLTASGVTVGAIPQVMNVTPDSGDYGTSMTISGTGFGNNASGFGFVSLGGSSEGVQVTDWSDTQIVVLLQDPARSGVVQVVADGTASVESSEFTVTSPHFTIDVMKPEQRRLKGMTAEVVCSISFWNGFEADSDITFEVPGASDIANFSPVPISKPGGVLLRLETDTLTEGLHEFSIKVSKNGAPDRSVPFFVKVVTVSEVIFKASEPGMWDYQPVTSLNLTAQQEIEWQVEAVASDGSKLIYDIPYTAVSSNPGVVMLIPDNWGGYDGFAVDTGTADIQVTYPDGTQAVLPVNVNLTDAPKVEHVSVYPSTVTNRGDQVIQVYADGGERLTSVSWDIPFDGWLDGDFYDSSTKYSATGNVYEGASPGHYGFGASIQGAFRVAPLQVINDPNRGLISGKLFSLRPGDDESMLMGAEYELYDLNGELISTHWGDHYGEFGQIKIYYVEPGTYKMRVKFWDDHYAPQWYPNAQSFEEAQAVEVVAGETLEDMFFFLIPGEPVPPQVIYTEPGNGDPFVSPDTPIKAYFDKEMASWSFDNSTFVVRDPNLNAVSGEITFDYNAVIFTPNSSLALATTYTVTISGEVMDTNGQVMGEDYIWSFTTGTNRLGSIHNLQDGTRVSLSSKVLHKIMPGGYTGYIQEQDRSSGIRVEGFLNGSENDLVSITGTLNTNLHGERFIQLEGSSILSSGMELRPLTATNRAVVNDMLTGMHVRVFGKVQAEGYSPTTFTLSDGSMTESILVVSDVDHMVPIGTYVMVTGAAGIENGKRIIYSRSLLH